MEAHPSVDNCCGRAQYSRYDGDDAIVGCMDASVHAHQCSSSNLCHPLMFHTWCSYVVNVRHLIRQMYSCIIITVICILFMFIFNLTEGLAVGVGFGSAEVKESSSFASARFAIKKVNVHLCA